MRRRALLGTAASSMLCLAGLPGLSLARAQPAPHARRDQEGAPLAPWRAGWMDIHHIATGRGNATLVIFPDGTSLLIDAGASLASLDVSVAPRPDATRRPGQWIARYLQRQLRSAGLGQGLDYLLVTHLHPDHLGDVEAASPMAAGGSYRLTGVMDVAELLPIGMVIDRGFPHYAYPAQFKAPFADNYRAFIGARSTAGKAVEAFRVGSAAQIGARGHRPWATPFEVRNLAANGQVWSGVGEGSTALFPPLDSLPAADWPTENSCSIALRIAYGQFAYFTGGDLTSYTDDGALPWRDVLGPAARAAGPVTVATADHHGMFDALNGDIVRTLRPRAWVIPAWHIGHPDLLQLERMFSQRLYPGPREVYATTVMPQNLLANGRLTRRMASHDGHIVVRVLPGGGSMYIAVTDNRDEGDLVRRMGEVMTL